MNSAPAPFATAFRLPEDRATLFRILAAAPGGLTRPQILERWPADPAAPDEVSLWRWLMRGARDGTIVRTGIGKRGRPFVYRLAAFDAPAGAVAESQC
jgi:hypothetical protein